MHCHYYRMGVNFITWHLRPFQLGLGPPSIHMNPGLHPRSILCHSHNEGDNPQHFPVYVFSCSLALYGECPLLANGPRYLVFNS